MSFPSLQSVDDDSVMMDLWDDDNKGLFSEIFYF